MLVFEKYLFFNFSNVLLEFVYILYIYMFMLIYVMGFCFGKLILRCSFCLVIFEFNRRVVGIIGRCSFFKMGFREMIEVIWVIS